MAPFRAISAALRITSLLLMSHASVATAATLQVSPILIQFHKGAQAQPIWLSNQGESPVRAQVRVYKWTQSDNGDHLEITNDLVASPPIMEVGAGQRQLLRIVRRSQGTALHEQAFRVIVDELPDSGATAADASSALSFLLRYSIPAFVSHTAAPSKNPDHQTSGKILMNPPRIQITNDGESRIRVAKLIYEGRDGKKSDVLDGLVGYVLTKNQRVWEFPESAEFVAPGTFKIKIANEAGEYTLQMDMPQN